MLHALHICHLDISLHNVLIHDLGAKDETVMIWYTYLLCNFEVDTMTMSKVNDVNMKIV